MTALDWAYNMGHTSAVVGLDSVSIAIDGYDAVNEAAAITEAEAFERELATTYKVVDLALRATITGGLKLDDAHRLVAFLKGQDPQLRLDIRTEFN